MNEQSANQVVVSGDVAETATPAAEETGQVHSMRHRLKEAFTPVDNIHQVDANAMARSILLEETSPPGSVGLTIAVISGFVFCFLIWAALTNFDEKAVAPGRILPTGSVQTIQHLEGGIVSQVLVKDGQEVVAGEPLVVLNETAARAERDALRAREAGLAMQAERLRAFAKEEAPNFGPWQADFPELVADAQTLHRSQLNAKASQLSIIDAQITASSAEAAGLLERERTLAEQVVLLQEEMNLREELLEKGLTSKVIYLATKRELNTAQGDLAQVKTEMARSQANALEVQNSRIELVESLRKEALDELNDVAAQREEVAEKLARLNDTVARTTIRAPVDGVVNGLLVTSAGSVIRAGDPVVDVVPTRQIMQAEVRVLPKDVGYIEVGLPVLVKVETYNFARYGGITGVVNRVSANSFEDEEGNSYFKAVVTLDQPFVGQDERANRVSSGMTVVADIKTGEKSLLGYLIRPVYNSLADAFSER